MKQRTITGVLLFLILAPLIVVDIMEYVFQMVMAILVVVAGVELIRMFEEKKKLDFLPKLCILSFTLITYLVCIYMGNNGSLGTYNFLYLLITLLLSAAVLFALILVPNRCNYDKNDAIKGLFTIIYAGIGISGLVLLRSISVNFIIYLFAITALTDIFAYLGGTLIGKHKMAPTISPKKTWEGAIVGSIFGTAAASCFAIFYGGNIFSAIFSELNSVVLIIVIVLLTLALTVCGQIGDLIASKLKRVYNIKDFGKIFPGHGGVLDRFDSAIFVSVVLFIMLTLFTL